MIRSVYLLLLLLLVALPATAEQPVYNMTITPGHPWDMVIKYTHSAAVPKPQFIAFIVAAPPLAEQVLAHMSVADSASPAYPDALMLHLTAAQTTALADKHANWQLVYLPDLGGATIQAHGRVGVRK